MTCNGRGLVDQSSVCSADTCDCGGRPVSSVAWLMACPSVTADRARSFVTLSVNKSSPRICRDWAARRGTRNSSPPVPHGTASYHLLLAVPYGRAEGRETSSRKHMGRHLSYERYMYKLEGRVVLLHTLIPEGMEHLQGSGRSGSQPGNYSNQGAKRLSFIFFEPCYLAFYKFILILQFLQNYLRVKC